eukprot:TRINITY_DN20813_c0_g1_i1.p1 TRINITY_DN20813_c0_g1~~TRINITY_DN20813_c0_g1_i1.p1  ORF type:complete len:295 (+),score=35.59 TRINITY_DN20813_c0_g1_i1:146-1030(+)
MDVGEPEGTGCKSSQTKITPSLVVHLLSGRQLSYDGPPICHAAALREWVAIKLDARFAQQVQLSQGGRVLLDEESLLDDNTPRVISAVLRGATARWLDDFLCAAPVGPDESQNLLALRASARDALGLVVERLRGETQRMFVSTAAADALAGWWRFGPRSEDDPRDYRLHLERDGSCAIFEGSWENGDYMCLCEWRGIWRGVGDFGGGGEGRDGEEVQKNAKTDDEQFVDVMAVPVLVDGGSALPGLQVAEFVDMKQGVFVVTYFWGPRGALRPQDPADLSRFVRVPQSRALLRH